MMATINATEAKRLQKLEQSLIKKFRDAEKEERSKSLPTDVPDVQVPLSNTVVQSPADNTPLTVSKAKRLAALEAKLQNEFIDTHNREIDEMQEREKQYEPITRAIKEQKEVESKAQQKQNRFKQLVKFRPRAGSTPAVKRQDFVDEDEPELTEPAQQNESMKQLMDTNVINLGAIGARYFPRANDNKFGIWYDEETDKPKIGSEAITFDFDDIILVKSKKKYRGTEGLWRLLTKNNVMAKDMFTQDDWRAYKDLLISTNALYQRNDPSQNRPKSSQGRKWKFMIKPVWDEHIKSLGDGDPDVFGSGLVTYNNKPTEYRYINNLNELINRLNYIRAQEEAGNNNFHNEKLSLVKFVYDRMEELVKSPNGIKYLIRCLSALPERVIEGSGLLNDIINKLPFELHAPRNWEFDTYNYCGPGTKLEQRLARGDKGINPLDEACKEHDIWYRDHKNTEDRWVADKVLQQKAWDRVTSADADLNERAIGLGTTGAMWLKRKLGMGLGTSSCIYPEHG